MCPAQFIERALFPMVVGAGVKLGSHDRGQDGALEYPCVLAELGVAFSPAVSNVNASIEEKRTHRQWIHLLFVTVRPKTSSGPPSLRSSRRAWRPDSVARRSLIARRTASELLGDPRALRSRRTLSVSSRRLVRVSATLLMAPSGV